MCKFQSLYFEDDGYVVRCNHCRNFQVGFSSTMLTLSEKEYKYFHTQLNHKCIEAAQDLPAHCKVIILKTPSPGICMMLTCKEARRLNVILEEADTEMKALHLMDLFNNPG